MHAIENTFQLVIPEANGKKNCMTILQAIYSLFFLAMTMQSEMLLLCSFQTDAVFFCFYKKKSTMGVVYVMLQHYMFTIQPILLLSYITRMERIIPEIFVLRHTLVFQNSMAIFTASQLEYGTTLNFVQSSRSKKMGAFQPKSEQKEKNYSNYRLYRCWFLQLSK